MIERRLKLTNNYILWEVSVLASSSPSVFIWPSFPRYLCASCNIHSPSVTPHQHVSPPPFNTHTATVDYGFRTLKKTIAMYIDNFWNLPCIFMLKFNKTDGIDGLHRRAIDRQRGCLANMLEISNVILARARSDCDRPERFSCRSCCRWMARNCPTWEAGGLGAR